MGVDQVGKGPVERDFLSMSDNHKQRRVILSLENLLLQIERKCGALIPEYKNMDPYSCPMSPQGFLDRL